MSSLLQAISKVCPSVTVEQAEQLLACVLGAERVDLLDPESPRGPRCKKATARLDNVVRKACRLQLRAEFPLTERGGEDRYDREDQGIGDTHNLPRDKARSDRPGSGFIVVKSSRAGNYQRVKVRIARNDADRLGFPPKATPKGQRNQRPHVVITQDSATGHLLLTTNEGKWVVNCSEREASFFVPQANAQRLGIWTDGVLRLPIVRQSQSLGKLVFGTTSGNHGNNVDCSPDKAESSSAKSVAQDPVQDRVIRELDLQERRRDFVWMGYVAKELLPGLGVAAQEAHAVLQRMIGEGIINTTKHPNPKNPEYPATGVKLNREHPLVKRVLGNGKSGPSRFPLGRIQGEPLSETIIRERR
jgi:hypothetical protein